MTKRSDIWMPLYIGDYQRDTTRLTRDQHGGYLLLIMDYWVNGPLPDDDGQLAAIVKAGAQEWRRLRPVLERFFYIEDGHWRHKRIDEERDSAASKSDKNRNAGIKSAEAKRQRNLNENPKNVAVFVNEKSTNVASLVSVSVNEKATNGAVSVAPPSSSPPDPPNNYPPSHSPSNTNVSAPAQPSRPFDPIKDLFDRGVAVLRRANVPDDKARKLIGRQRKDFGDAKVLSAIARCEVENPSDPVAFMAGCLVASDKRGKQPSFGAPGFA